MRLRDVTFAAWLRSHGEKDPEERWLRELYPWPVLAQVDCDAKNVGVSYLEAILEDGKPVGYRARLIETGGRSANVQLSSFRPV